MTQPGTPISPPPVLPHVGILGGGQLGRMLAQAAHRLAIPTRCWDQSADAVAGLLTDLHVDSFSEPKHLSTFLHELSIVTTEWENVPTDLLARIETMGMPIAPARQALATAQDRLSEKALAHSLSIPTPTFVPISSFQDLKSACSTIAGPCIIKTRTLGYDGKGQARLPAHPTEEQLSVAWKTLAGNQPAANLIAESFVPFIAEVSQLAVRNSAGQIQLYPLIENTHHQGILSTSLCPGPTVTPHLQSLAQRHTELILTSQNYVGLLAVEYFVIRTPKGKLELVFNEIAPRVHNSGHLTIEASHTSQFENHLRAIVGLPLGDPSLRTPDTHAAMLNIVSHRPSLAAVFAACPSAQVHDYAKPAREGRKLGHITLIAGDAQTLKAQVAKLQAILHKPAP